MIYGRAWLIKEFGRELILIKLVILSNIFIESNKKGKKKIKQLSNTLIVKNKDTVPVMISFCKLSKLHQSIRIAIW